MSGLIGFTIEMVNQEVFLVDGLLFGKFATVKNAALSNSIEQRGKKWAK